MKTHSPKIETILFASARASAHFAQRCLELYQGHLRARSSFVTPQGEIMHWHDFGDLEGPGWAANAVGGAHLLYRWGTYLDDRDMQARALALLDHVLEDGFVDQASGFIWPYYDLAQGRFCLNYAHNNDWLCPGSLAKVGEQLLQFADDLAGDVRALRMRETARCLGAWLHAHVPPLPNGWVPRRITLAGEPYPFTPTGGADPIYDHSADGLFLLQLYAALGTSSATARGLADYRADAVALGDAFVAAGSFWGSVNHDTYDDHENVAYATAFRVLRQAAGLLDRPGWVTFACQVALPGLARFQMHEDRNGVPTKGLLWMEESWKTAYLWENAEAALALLEAWGETGQAAHRDTALAILEAIARHHHGQHGFLSEGVDWENHVTRRHHVGEALYEDIRYTEPLLNNLHLLAPTLFYWQQIGFRPPEQVDDAAAIALVSALGQAARPPVPGKEGVRYLLRLYHPTLATDAGVTAALSFAQAAGVDGALLFESSFDVDPALLTLEALAGRFARLKEIVPRFRAAGLEVHINVMITLGHVDAGSARPERFPFGSRTAQFQVDEFGNRSRSSACPLDPAFLEYVAALYRMAAECGADAVWVDDDVRFWGHDIPGLTCFCPHHLAAIAVSLSTRTSQAWTCESLLAALRDDAARPAIRQAWFDLQEEAMLNLARTIERAVHVDKLTVDPAISLSTRIGLMTIGTSYHATEGRRTDRLLRTLAGTGRPLIRPGSGFWNDWTPATAVEKAEDCARQISFLGQDVQAVAEVENHPYTPFGKSERVLALELALDVLAGMPDLSLNLLSSMGGSGPLEPEGTDYASFLRRQRPFLDALACARAGRLRRGVGIAASENYARHAPVHGGPLRTWLECRPWEAMLARLGLPIGRPDLGPHLLAGEVARALPASTIDQYLGDGMLLDPIAARALVEAGWGERLGIRNVRPLGDGANELLTDDPLNGPRAGHLLPARSHIPVDQLYTFDLEEEGCRVLSRWIDVDGAERGLAAAALERPGGVRVGLLPYALQAPALVLLNVAHREQWAALLGWVSAAGHACSVTTRKLAMGEPAAGGLPCRIVRGVNLYPLAFVHPDDGSWLLAVANLSADDAQDAELDLAGICRSPGSVPESVPGSVQVERLAEDGQWQATTGLHDSRLRLDVRAFSLAAYRCQRLDAGEAERPSEGPDSHLLAPG